MLWMSPSLTDGKAGTVRSVLLDELHGLRISIKGHVGKWPISIKFVQSEIRGRDMVRASAYFEPAAQLGNRRSVPMTPKLSRRPAGRCVRSYGDGGHDD
jgi:hypothetical protein